jgi:MoaA/NifB/PqqE/SkfB family radical SAM enzyme
MRKFRRIETMDLGLYYKIIDEIAVENPDVRVWEVYFGDPCMCKDMDERIAYAKNAGLNDVVINTNGVLLTPKRAESFIKAGLDAIYVGIDSVTEDTYNRIRIGGNYQQTVKNVLHYRDLLSKYGNNGQQLFVQFVVSEFNEEEVEPFKNFWTAEGVNVKIRPKVSWAGLIEAANLRDNSMVERKPCYWLMRTLPICTDGRAALCAIDLRVPLHLGNAVTMSIKEIWNGQLKEYRRMHLECRFDQLPDLCRNCRDWQSGYAEFLKPSENQSIMRV